MLKIGITGGIGSGKSLVSSLFADLGVRVFDSDKAARQLIDTDPAIRTALIQSFGADIYLPHDGGLDRKKMGALVFKDQKALEKLNEITHPPVIKAASAWMEQEAARISAAKAIAKYGARDPQLPLKADPVSYVIKEAALLFESGSHKDLDFILSVYAPETVRVQRVMARDQVDAKAVQSRIRKQMDETSKVKASDGLIINDGKALLWPQVLGWHAHFMQLGAAAS